MKTISVIIALSCIVDGGISQCYAQTTDELIQYSKLIDKADSFFELREYKKSLNLYERAYKLCGCKYPYEQVRFIKDGNLIIRNRKKYNGERE